MPCASAAGALGRGRRGHSRRAARPTAAASGSAARPRRRMPGARSWPRRVRADAHVRAQVDRAARGRWCAEHHVAARALRRAADIRRQLARQLAALGLPPGGAPGAPDAPDALRRALVAGLFPHAAAAVPGGARARAPSSRLASVCAGSAVLWQVCCHLHPALAMPGGARGSRARMQRARVRVCPYAQRRAQAARRPLARPGSAGQAGARLDLGRARARRRAGTRGPGPRAGGYRVLATGQAVALHPSSVLCGERPPCIVFDELLRTTRDYARQARPRPGALCPRFVLLCLNFHSILGPSLMLLTSTRLSASLQAAPVAGGMSCPAGHACTATAPTVPSPGARHLRPRSTRVFSLRRTLHPILGSPSSADAWRGLPAGDCHRCGLAAGAGPDLLRAACGRRGERPAAAGVTAPPHGYMRLT